MRRSSAKRRGCFLLFMNLPTGAAAGSAPTPSGGELRHLYDHHPDLWARMLELQALPGKVSEKFNRTQKFSDIDALFWAEDEQAEPLNKAA